MGFLTSARWSWIATTAFCTAARISARSRSGCVSARSARVCPLDKGRAQRHPTKPEKRSQHAQRDTKHSQSCVQIQPGDLVVRLEELNVAAGAAGYVEQRSAPVAWFLVDDGLQALDLGVDRVGGAGRVLAARGAPPVDLAVRPSGVTQALGARLLPRCPFECHVIPKRRWPLSRSRAPCSNMTHPLG